MKIVKTSECGSAGVELSPAELKILRAYRRCNQKAQEFLVRYCDVLAARPSQQKNSPVSRDGDIKIPVCIAGGTS